jgi:CheY-like chemotaxis protein
MKSFLQQRFTDIRNEWDRLSLKSRVIYPVIALLLVTMFVGGYILNRHEQSGIRQQLDREAGMLANSLAHTAIGNMDKLIREQAELNSSIHSVLITSPQGQIIFHFNRNQLVDRLLPDAVHFYSEPFTADNQIRIGMFHHNALTLIFIYSVCALMVIFITVALLNMLLNHEVLLPINHLEQHMIRMAQGMLDKIIVTENQSEIGHLSRSINAVRTRLKRLLAIHSTAPAPAATDAIDTTQFHMPPVSASLTGTRILITDDDPTVRMIAGKLLEKHGAVPVYAENGHECLQRLATDSFDMVLLDLMMPGLTGYEVLQTIQHDTRYENLPVIVISSSTEKDATVNALQLGAVDYVHKPFNSNELIARIRTHLGLSNRRKYLVNFLSNKTPGIAAADN